MSKFDEASRMDLPSLKLRGEEATDLRQRLLAEGPEQVIEVCRVPGQISLIVAAVLEDVGQGNLTTLQPRDWGEAERFSLAVKRLDLSHRISPIFYERSYSWAIKRLLAAPDRPIFDICILNGNKSWDASGFGLLLSDMLLRPGGLLIVTDLDWSMAGSPYFRQNPEIADRHEVEEFKSEPVRIAVDLVLPHLGYDAPEISTGRGLAFARKPSIAFSANRQRSGG